MALPVFDYTRATSLEEASKLAAEKGDKAVLMAGGTDVILLIHAKAIPAELVIDIKEIPGLDEIKYVEGEGMHIGALAKLFDIQSSPVVEEKMPALCDAARYVASPQIRRKGTMAGNICNASPSADTASILVAMKAVVKVYNVKGEKEIPIDEFFKGVKKTVLEPGDVVTEIFIPELKKGEGSAYFKHSVRKAMDLAIIGVGSKITMDGSKITDARICMGGVGITPLRAKNAEKILIGNEITDELLEQAGVAASEECSPISDVRASAEYRKDMVRVYTKRAVKKAVETMA
ncbi:MAG: xanthine dehydrogenase family protein subunit M [Clostridiales bacterium]|nr:xanthine dehydrogenase family protein subunit M [Clostridiales bacterium]MDD7035448.1 xanthine dehydrogenase family protein subunit M [Bacillota bacterium]MDY2919969.1 xanthine dehydrogenase family protein subunit M [Lentihominibacter sp.]